MFLFKIRSYVWQPNRIVPTDTRTSTLRIDEISLNLDETKNLNFKDTFHAGKLADHIKIKEMNKSGRNLDIMVIEVRLQGIAILAQRYLSMRDQFQRTKMMTYKEPVVVWKRDIAK